MTKIFKAKIFEARQKSSKSLTIFTHKNFRLYCIYVIDSIASAYNYNTGNLTRVLLISLLIV